jgi:hypothetical protein
VAASFNLRTQETKLLSLQAIEAFANDYLRTPFGNNVSAVPLPEAYSTPLLWLEKLYSDPEKTAAPLPHDVVERLQMEIKVCTNWLVCYLAC